jgi:NAD(P)-dependent dehydrogenase (short-subunit alcohol dehydrogenase family)
LLVLPPMPSPRATPTSPFRPVGCAVAVRYGEETANTASAGCSSRLTCSTAHRSLAAVERVNARFDRIDVLCNLAGGFRMGDPVHKTADHDWNFLFDINTRTLLHMARAVVPRMMQSGGKIVNVGAASALKGSAQMGAYVASKSAVIRLTESMAAELRTHNINVNCVLPTIIDTPENRKAMPDADPSKWVAPADLANVIVFLASAGARAIHGAAIPVSGLS